MASALLASSTHIQNGVNQTDQPNDSDQQQQQHHNLRQKKKNYTMETRSSLDIVKTGGGIKILFSTTLYTQFQQKSKDYFKRKGTDQEVEIDWVTNENSDTIRVRKSDGVGIYTVNMYHSTATLLINGKEPELFLDEDLDNILDNILDNSLPVISDHVASPLPSNLESFNNEDLDSVLSAVSNHGASPLSSNHESHETDGEISFKEEHAPNTCDKVSDPSDIDPLFPC